MGKTRGGFNNLYRYALLSCQKRATVRIIGLVIGLFCLFFGKAQTTLQPMGARYLTLGAYTQNGLDVYAAQANAASLAGLKQSGVSTYAERRFGLDNMNLYTFSGAIVTGSGTFGLQGAYFGFAESNQTQMTLAYGRKISKTIEVGGSFHYHNISQSGIYGNSTAITGSASLRMKLSDKITAGLNLFNPVRATWSKTTDERLPVRYTVGLGYDASDKFLITTELEKEEGQNLNVNLGFQYSILPQLFFRGGIATQTSNYFGGIGLNLKDFRIDIATSYHPQLGLTPGVLLLLNLGKQKQENQKDKTGDQKD
jgi:hypothetical protein